MSEGHSLRTLQSPWKRNSRCVTWIRSGNSVRNCESPPLWLRFLLSSPRIYPPKSIKYFSRLPSTYFISRDPIGQLTIVLSPRRSKLLSTMLWFVTASVPAFSGNRACLFGLYHSGMPLFSDLQMTATTEFFKDVGAPITSAFFKWIF